MFWFGWTAHFDYVHWIVPTLAGGFAATAMLTIFVSFLNYLVDTYLMFAASAIAANTVARSAAGSAAPLFTDQMFKALGIGGGSSLIGGVAILLAFIPILFFKYGEGIRIKSRFAPTGPKKQPDVADAAEKGAVRERQDSHNTELTVGEIQSNLVGMDKREGRGDQDITDSKLFDYSTDDSKAGGHQADGDSTDGGN